MRLDYNLESQFSASWQERAEKCADLIASLKLKKVISIADLGCGDRKLFKKLAQLKIKFKYYGFDLNPQTTDVKKINVNTENLKNHYSIITALGLTEYVDINKLFFLAKNKSKYFIVSHLLKNQKYSREAQLANGWINHLDINEFEDLLIKAEFKILKKEMTFDSKTMIWLCC